MSPFLSVVVPVYRNADTVRELLARICRTCEARLISFEIVFVDDACPDGSLAVLKEIAQSDPRVIVLALARNLGQHQAVLAGLAHARGDWVAIMDADLQDPPEVLPELLQRGQSGYAAVFAGRRGQYESSARLLTSRFFKWVLRAVAGVPADAGIFCLLSRALAEKLLSMNDGRASIVAMIGCAGLPMISVPVIRAQRRAGQSAYNTRMRIKNAWRAIAWALHWKWRTWLRRPRPRAAALPALVVYGQRVLQNRNGE